MYIKRVHLAEMERSGSSQSNRVRTPTYAHSPYAYRTEDGAGPTTPLGPKDRPSRPILCSNSCSGNAAEATLGTPLESSSPIQVGSSLNVLPRYRRGQQSPHSHTGSYGCGDSAFPNSPYQSHDDHSNFAGRDPTPVWVAASSVGSNPYPHHGMQAGSASVNTGLRRSSHNHMSMPSGGNTPTHPVTPQGPSHHASTYAPVKFMMPSPVASQVRSPPPHSYGSQPSSPMGQSGPVPYTSNNSVLPHATEVGLQRNSLHGQSSNGLNQGFGFLLPPSDSPSNFKESSNSSLKSCSSASSVRDDLPLCANDDACALINDRKHQRKCAHTCRLFPCYHGHIVRHAKLFRHIPGQISKPEGINTTKMSTHALASVNFNTISPEAPNAYRIYVSHGLKSYEIFGDWSSVKVHTFKRYLHQVYCIPPTAQQLAVLKTGKVMSDDLSSVKSYDIDEDAVIELRSELLSTNPTRVSFDDL